MKLKKILSSLLVFVMLFSTIPYIANAQINHTQAEAVAWITARKNEGWAQDKDGAYGAQCVDLIHYYLDFWGVPRYSGNANTYISKSLPSGWVYTKSPSPGDIAVWDINKGIARSTGHVALVESVSGNNFAYVGVNGSTHSSGCGTTTISNPSTFIHPNFTVASAPAPAPTPAPTTKYANISLGKYFIRNNGTGKYLCLGESGKSTNVWVWERNGYTYEFEMEIASASSGYRIIPTCQSNKVLNVYADTVVSGKNVNVLRDGNNGTQWWAFEAVNGGYVIRNVSNSSVCLSIDSSGYNVIVSNYSGSANQIWSLETSAPKHTHNYNQKNTDNKYLKSSANCTSATVYYYSCSCGEKGSNTFTSGNALGHDYEETVYDTYKEYKCSRCGNSYKENIEAPAPTPAPQPNTYTLTYNANGGSNAPSSQTQTENGKLIVSNDTPTRNGYNFLGWALNKSAVVPAYYGGNSVVMIDNTTLYAVWEEIEENYYEENNNYIMEFWLFYDANGGVGAPAPVTEEEGTRITITSKEPTRTGYTFLGWSESAYSTEPDYTVGDRLILERNTTLFGVWKKDNDSYWDGKSAPSDWAVEEVEQAIACGLVPENLQKNFTMPVYRLEVAGMFINLIEGMTGKDIDDILRLAGVSRNQSAFTDTKDSDVLAANALGIINGVGNKTFDCYGTLTRGEIAAILNRTAKVMGIKTTGYSHNFTDCKNHWCSAELGYPTHAGIITGVGNNKFAPDEKLTTEQAIAIVYRAFCIGL